MIEIQDAKKNVIKLRNDSNQTLALGCPSCAEFNTCGGLRVSAGLLDCLGNCNCTDKSKCNVVCPRNNDFPSRYQEVRGFEFSDVHKRTPLMKRLNLPNAVHLLYRSPKISGLIDLDVAAIPLSQVINRSGHKGSALSRLELQNRFKLSPSTKLILSGVEFDRNLEKWWGARHGRVEMLEGISKLQPLIVSTPNFSNIIDTPRHDALHSLKRIVLAWSELHDFGIPTALHLNGTTDRDYERIADFLRTHNEIKAVSVEFETGAATNLRGQYHVGQLQRLVQKVGRPLHLVFRGNPRWLPSLRKDFTQFTVLNAQASMKTRQRQRAEYDNSGKLRWKSFPTALGATLDELHAHNLTAVSSWLGAKLLNGSQAPEKIAALKTMASEVQPETEYKSAQMSFF
jgi:hypothetical protein